MNERKMIVTPNRFRLGKKNTHKNAIVLIRLLIFCRISSAEQRRQEKMENTFSEHRMGLFVFHYDNMCIWKIVNGDILRTAVCFNARFSFSNDHIYSRSFFALRLSQIHLIDTRT